MPVQPQVRMQRVLCLRYAQLVFIIFVPLKNLEYPLNPWTSPNSLSTMCIDRHSLVLSCDFGWNRLKITGKNDTNKQNKFQDHWTFSPKCFLLSTQRCFRPCCLRPYLGNRSNMKADGGRYDVVGGGLACQMPHDSKWAVWGQLAVDSEEYAALSFSPLSLPGISQGNI